MKIFVLMKSQTFTQQAIGDVHISWIKFSHLKFTFIKGIRSNSLVCVFQVLHVALQILFSPQTAYR